MSKVDLDYTNLKTNCILNLSDTINLMNKVLNYFDNFDIPYDFSKKNDLKNVEIKLRNVKTELNKVKNWMVDSNNNYDILINNLKNQANRLPTYRVKQRNNIV